MSEALRREAQPEEAEAPALSVVEAEKASPEASPEAPPEAPSEAARADAAMLPMAWHAFLVKGMLWIAPLVHLAQMGLLVSGRVYYTLEIRDAIYRGMPAMIAVDAALCVSWLAGALLQACARHALARRRARGIRLLKGAYAALFGGTLVYGIARLAVAGLSPLSAPILLSLCGYALLYGIHSRYYRMRRAFFSPEEG